MTHMNNQRIKEETIKKIRKYFEYFEKTKPQNDTKIYEI